MQDGSEDNNLPNDSWRWKFQFSRSENWKTMEQEVNVIKPKPRMLPKDPEETKGAGSMKIVRPAALGMSAKSFKTESLKELVEEECEQDQPVKNKGKKIQSSLDAVGEWEYTQEVPGGGDNKSLLSHLERLEEEPKAHSSPSSPSSRSDYNKAMGVGIMRGYWKAQ
uniref:Uncharacterized protein n=1 Tax=Guillardia theta TaxID=55529 RepID=A0A7S4NMZ6_GUITH|mmetsp:Transcript_25659/g.84737  ORF Transcript_25659/g.84737 Transcript_25659/m.84737 type:complete len:166 (+) Transcript_25659:190-687(+)